MTYINVIVRKLLNFFKCLMPPYFESKNKVENIPLKKISFNNRVEQFERVGHFYRPIKTRANLIPRQVPYLLANKSARI